MGIPPAVSRLATRPAAEAGAVDPVPGTDFFRKLFDNLYDGVYFVDPERRILYWNKGAELLTGYPASEVVGSSCGDHILDHRGEGGCQLCAGGCPLAATMQDGRPRSRRVSMRHRDGRRIAVDTHVMPVRDEAGRVVGGVEIFRDASPMVALELANAELRAVAATDPLTGLANRRQLDAALERHRILLDRTGIPFGLVLIDIDHFKAVNDTLGHAAGDRALVGFAAALGRHCRPSDLVGRYGGEEFLILVPGIRLAEAARLAERLRGAVAGAPAEAFGGARLTASFGVVEARPGEPAAALTARADAALYAAKAAGRNRVVVGPPQGG
jgi:diguanylate cyclase (GGDEF)-like protein/PAS domain S-box-containing protein